MAALIDTSVLVYRYDPRVPVKQRVASDLLRWAVELGTGWVPHQAVVEFVDAVTRPDATGRALLAPHEALREAEDFLHLFTVVYPSEEVLRTAVRGAATYRLSWQDAHLWAYAEVYGLPELVSEDFEHGRLYGTVRVVNPFAPAEVVHESMARYG